MKLKPVIEMQPKSDAFIHSNPVLNRVFQNRGLQSPQDIDYKLSRLIPPHLMKGMKEAVDIIINSILADEVVVIVGDYDCDGATATSVAILGLLALGLKNVHYIVPDRMIHGYGLSPSIVEMAGELGADLIITVDNGISSFEGAEAVKKLPKPCQLVVTDHHLPADKEKGVPDADAIVNPNQHGCPFPSKAIAGCGVMFYVIMALRKEMRERGLFDKLGIPESSLNPLLDIVALGTVADVVSMADYNNRVLVQFGLDRINKGLARPGLDAILTLKNRTIGDIVASDMGFSAGPSINAAGRLELMNEGIECLTEDNPILAQSRAERLVSLNEQRREMSAEMEDEALEILEEMDLATARYGVCLHDPLWHEGVIGILAGRIKERLSRPVIVFTDTHQAAEMRRKLEEAKELGASDDELAQIEEALNQCDIKGSSRSVDGVHMKHVLDHINKTHPEILSKFGGHAMAAGMSLKVGQYDKFQELFDKLVREDLTEEMIRGRVDVDIKDIDPELITLETAQLIRDNGPWGQKFEEPTFSQQFIVEKYIVRKDKHLSMKLRAKGTDKIFEAMCFNCVEKGVLPIREKSEIEASFKMDINKWRGNVKLQLLVDYMVDPELVKDQEMDDEVSTTVEAAGAIARQKAAMKAAPGGRPFAPAV